jgi:hypothetical protein
MLAERGSAGEGRRSVVGRDRPAVAQAQPPQLVGARDQQREGGRREGELAGGGPHGAEQLLKGCKGPVAGHADLAQGRGLGAGREGETPPSSVSARGSPVRRVAWASGHEPGLGGFAPEHQHFRASAETAAAARPAAAAPSARRTVAAAAGARDRAEAGAARWARTVPAGALRWRIQPPGAHWPGGPAKSARSVPRFAIAAPPFVLGAGNQPAMLALLAASLRSARTAGCCAGAARGPAEGGRTQAPTSPPRRGLGCSRPAACADSRPPRGGLPRGP